LGRRITVKKLVGKSLLVPLVIAIVAFPLAQTLARPAAAEEAKPVLVTSIAGADEVLGDVLFLTESAGVGDFGRLIALMASPYTATLDKKKPIGGYALLEEDNQLASVMFVPVKDLKMLLTTLESQVGKPEDAGDGVQRIATDRPQPVYVKEAHGWAFVSNEKRHLADLPKDPVKLLDGLNEQYTLALRVNVANVPADLRQTAVDQLRRGFEERLAEELDEKQAEAMRQIGGFLVDTLIRLIEETDHVTLGWQVDAAEKKTYLDLQVTAVEDTELAEQMGQVKEGRSAFSGCLLPGAALTFHMHATSTEAEIEQAMLLVDRLREEAMKGIEKDDNLVNDEERQTARTIVNEMLDIVEGSLKTGKTDCGGVLSLKPDALTLAIGCFVADGQQLADAVKELAAFAEQKDPNFPTIDFDAEKHRGVTFHTATIPLRTGPPEVRRVLGDPMEVVVGTGKKAVYLAFGKDAGQLLKEVLDGSVENRSKKLPPAEVVVSLTPVLEFAAAMEKRPRQLRQVEAALEAVKTLSGSDHISLRAMPIKNGCRVRLEIEEGVLKAIGAAAKAPTQPPAGQP
jgi:hypothetical protein